MPVRKRIHTTVSDKYSAHTNKRPGQVRRMIAAEAARISFHVFNDPPDAIAMHLLAKNVVFRNEQRKIRWHDGSHRQLPLLITDAEGQEIELALFRYVDLRQAPPGPVDGRPQKRASLSEVECLLTAG